MMNSDRVSLSIEHKLVATPPLNLPFILWCMRQVRVLHNLGKQETLLVVIPISTIYSVDVGQPSESRPRAAVFVDTFKRIPYPVTVLTTSVTVTNPYCKVKNIPASCR
jgi:hypothetical protein